MEPDTNTMEAFVERKVVSALILGLCGFFLLPVIGSLLAIVVAHQARRMLRDSPDHPSRSLATAALAIGWTGLVVGVAGMSYIIAT